jgi:tetratricopeptide (TPR) repeat protein
LNHAHSLYLQVAVEQGIPGLIGLFGLLAGALGLGWQWLQHEDEPERSYAAGAMTALIGLLIYGCTDAELYAGLFAPLFFLPVAVLLACAPAEAPDEATTPPAQIEFARWLGGLVPIAALLLLFTLPGTPLRWQINQATVAQTRAELGLYRWPAWPIQDAVRRSGQLNSSQWRQRYLAVLAADPENAPAARRLGQIALSLGDYQQAEQWLTTAYAVAPQQRATRQLLGEAKALLGDEQAAEALWQTVDLRQGQLELRRWWYEQVDDAMVVAQFASVMDEYAVR